MKKTPKFERTHATLTGEDYDGKYHDERRVRLVAPVPTDNDDECFRVVTDTGERIEVDSCDLSPMPDSPALNTEKLMHFCERSAHGHMGQVFLIEAVVKYAEMVENMPQDQRDSVANGMISYDLWASVAAEAREFFTRRED